MYPELWLGTRGGYGMTGFRAHGIVIDPFVCHSPAEATLERVIDGNDERLIGRDERVDQQPKQDPAELQGRPDGTIEDTMIGREVAFTDQANHT